MRFRCPTDFFGVEIPRDSVTNEITAGLAFRHVLVHNGGIVDRQCLRQVESATPRAFRPRVNNGESLSFATAEIAVLASAMVTYVRRLAKEVGARATTTAAQPATSGAGQERAAHKHHGG